MTSAAAAATITNIITSSLLALVTVTAKSKMAVDGTAAMFVGGEERGPMAAGTVGVGSEVVRQVGLTASSQGQVVVVVAGELGGSLGEVPDEQVFAVGASVEDVAAAAGRWSFICRCCSSQARCIGRENGDELV